MEHLADELDRWWFVWVLLFEMHNESESSIFKRGIRRSNNHSVPGTRSVKAL